MVCRVYRGPTCSACSASSMLQPCCSAAADVRILRRFAFGPLLACMTDQQCVSCVSHGGHDWHICPVHMQEAMQPYPEACLRQAVSCAGPQPAAQTPQIPESKSSHINTREALQSRADKLQGGKLTALLMSWFDAGYQTGRLESELQQI